MVALSEDYTGANGAPWSSQWTGYVGSGASATIQNNSGRLRTNGGDYNGASKVTQRFTTAIGDSETVFEFWDDGSEQYPIWAWRADNILDGVSGYYLYLTSNPQVQVSTNYSGTVKGSMSLTLAPGTRYRCRVRVQGTSHKVKIWRSIDPEPTTGGVDGAGYQISFSDSTYSTGSSGFSVAVGGPTQVRDWWVDTLTMGDPGAVTAPPTASAGNDQAGIEPGTAMTLVGTPSPGATSESWAQISGPTVALSGSGGSRTYEAPGTLNGATLVFRYTVTSSSGTATSDRTVTVLPATEWMYDANGVLRPVYLLSSF